MQWMRAAGLLLALGLAGCGHVSRHPAENTGTTGTVDSTGTAGDSAGAPAMEAEPALDPHIVPSTGCGRDLPPEQLPTVPGARSGYTEFFVTQTGATLATDQPHSAGERQFFVRVPADYDPNHPYRVVYVLQGCGGLRSGDKSTYPLFDANRGGTEQAVYVAVSVPDNDANPSCYDTERGADSQEWEAFDLIHTFVESHYCVDNDRIFVAGFSSGAYVSNMYGCYFGGIPSPPLDEPDLTAGRSERRFAPRWPVRGHAQVSGQVPENQPLACNGPSAGLWMHDVQDHSTPLAGDIAALNLALKTNGCTGNYADGPREPWTPPGVDGVLAGVCQRYTGCPADVAARYPLIFCTTQLGAHSDMSPLFIPAFAAFAASMDPAR